MGVWIALIFSTIIAVLEWLALFSAFNIWTLLFASIETVFAVSCIMGLLKEQEQQWRTILFYISAADMALTVVVAFFVIIFTGFFLGTIIIYAISITLSFFWTTMFYMWMKELNENWKSTNRKQAEDRRPISVWTSEISCLTLKWDPQQTWQDKTSNSTQAIYVYSNPP